jgi:8-oxo-dGTP pyrophosphatase MutT (NUDIX family)
MVFLEKYNRNNKMGACFSKEQQEEHPYTRFEKTPRNYTSLGEDNANEIMQRIARNGQKPLCCFAPNCNRKNPYHNLEFSHDPLNYDGKIASNERCRKVYPASSRQILLDGGCESSFQEPLNENIVKNAGCCIITSGSIVFVVEKCSGKLNFPCGKCEPNEGSLPCAGRETNEELGFNPFQNGIRIDHMWTFVRSHISRKTGKKSQSVIYVFDHSQSADWFIRNFRPNKECSDIFVMPISLFVKDVEERPTIFRFPESMKQFIEQLKDRTLI